MMFFLTAVLSLPAPSTQLTCKTLLAEGTNLNDSDKYCVDLPTEEACGTLNYVAIADTYHQCGWRFGQCLAKYGDLECPIAAPPPSCPPPVGCLGYSPGQIISYEDAKACTVSACRAKARTCTASILPRPLTTRSPMLLGQDILGAC
jgi:hypothetical protein